MPPPPAAPFKPHPLIAAQMTQSILATKRPVRRRWERRGSRMDALAVSHALDCGDGVRLTGRHSRQPDGREPRGLAVLIHGWEGSHDSVYLYSTACHLFEAGWNIFRLNLRDHGGTHALNEALFHSARINEVINAIAAVRAFDTTPRLAVIGWSLGGNFALRVGLYGPARGVQPQLAIGVSPSIDPGATLVAIDSGPALIRRYFLDKWRKTLRTKAGAWPGRYDFSALSKIDSFVEITREFVKDHTEYATLDAYLAAYTLRPPQLMASPTPLAILTAQDDTVIPFRDFDGLAARGSVLAFDAPARGGHCGFIENLALESWADRRVLELVHTL
jgi:predicted alpha/beta-fold hydrolase